MFYFSCRTQIQNTQDLFVGLFCHEMQAGGRAELTEKHLHTKKTSTREFMQSGQISVGALYVNNDSGLILVWKIHESAI